VSILPKKPHLPQTSLIGLDGTPHSGKTTLSDVFALNYSESSSHALQLVDPDSLYVQGEGRIMHVAMNLLDPSLDDEMPLVLEKDDWFTHLWHQFNKQLFWENQIHNTIYSAKSGETRLILAQRSPVDQTVFSYSLITHQTDLDYSIPPQDKTIAQELYLKTIIGSQAAVQFMDAVVLIGTDQGVAQKRRKEMGRTSKGIADSPFFKDLSAWYGFWIENVWPKLYKLNGTGLLVLDGNKPLEENIETLSIYINKSSQQCLPDIIR